MRYEATDKVLLPRIYAGPAEGTLPGYLAAAAAMQSRAFPAFTYDPGAGPDLASRFSLENNPQPDVDWPATTSVSPP